MKNKIIKSILTLIMIVGVFATLDNGNVDNIKAATNAADAPEDWAFTEDSIPMHNAILAKYPSIDQVPNGNGDGYISISEANSYSGGRIEIHGEATTIITGTLDGIEHFTLINVLYINGPQVTGSIPANIDNLTSLEELTIIKSQISGSIPTSIGNMTTLNRLELWSNQLTGTIPSELGQLYKLETLTLSNNQLTGSIPEELSDLTALKILALANNQLTGELPEGFKNFTSLERFQVSGNIDLTGNPAEIFVDNTVLWVFQVDGTSLVQAKPALAPITNYLYDNQAENLLTSDKSTLAEGVTQADIDLAQESADWMTNTVEQQQWQADIDLAQEYLAIKNVNNLFTDENHLDIKDSTIQLTIDEVQKTVDKLSDNDLKTELQKEIDKAKNMLDAKDKVNNLFNEDKTDLSDGVAQDEIDDAQKAVDKLYDSELKEELQKEIDKALDMLNAKDKVNNLFNEDKTDLSDNVTQDEIDGAQKAVDKLDDSDLKDELQKEIGKAQDMLNAKDAVDDLFDDEDFLNDDVTQDDIKNAQDLVNKLPEGDLKNELNDRLKDAQKQLDERNFVIIEAFKVFTGEGTVYTKIDASMEKFSKVYVDGKELDASNYEVTSGSTVITLTEAYLKTLENGTYDVDVEFTSGAVVSTELTVKVTLTHPSITPPATTNPTPGTPTVSKPSTDVGSTTNSSSVNTGDATDLAGLYAMLALSILGIVVVRKRKEA